MDKDIYCNACGRKLKIKKGLPLEDAFYVRKDWGYFSKKDLETDVFVMCEDCYDKLTASFVIPVKRMDKTEAM